MRRKKIPPRVRGKAIDPRANYRIRIITAADRQGWTGLRRALWPHRSRRELEEDADIFFRSQKAGRFRRNGMIATVLVAELATGNLVGFAEVDLRPYADGCQSYPVGYLEGWFVAPGTRRMGIGRALVEAAEAWAGQQGCVEMASDTEITNRSSRLAHAALHYGEVGRLVHFRRDLRSPKPNGTA